MDDAELKAEQRRNWSAAAAGWDKWWDTIERAAQPLSDRLVALADIRPGAATQGPASGHVDHHAETAEAGDRPIC